MSSDSSTAPKPSATPKPRTKAKMRAAVLIKKLPNPRLAWDEAIVKAVQIKERNIPRPGKGEVRIKMMAAAINRRDCFMCIDLYPDVNPPYILGTDMAGIIDAVGKEVDQQWIGKEVVVDPRSSKTATTFGHNDLRKRGCLAEFICCDLEQLVEKPSSMTFEEAAAIPVCACTAWSALFEQAKCRAGDRVLIPGVGGATATMAMQMALAIGAQVVVTSSSKQKIENAKKMGALGGVSWKTPLWPYEAMKLLPEGKQDGFDVVIDGVGGMGFGGIQIACARNARIVSYGGTAGNWPNLNPAYFFMKEINILHTMMSQQKSALKDVLAFFVKHQLPPILHTKTFKLEEVHDAMKLVSNNKTTGKVIITSNKLDDAVKLVSNNETTDKVIVPTNDN